MMSICNENKPYIFISYSHRDANRIFPIIYRLRSEGYNLWYDEGIEAGSEWDENIANHIMQSSYFIAFISENYLNSTNCKDELNYARDLDKEQFLIYLEDVTLPAGMAMRMNRIQAIMWNRFDEKTLENAYQKIFVAAGIQKTRIYHEQVSTKTYQEKKTYVDMEQPVQVHQPVQVSIGSQNINEKQDKNKIPFLKPMLIIAGILVGILIILLIVLAVVLYLNKNKDNIAQGYREEYSYEYNPEEDIYGDNTYEEEVYYGDEQTQFDVWLDLAEEGDIDAMYNVGMAYKYSQNGMEENFDEAYKWFSEAACLGHVNAMCETVDLLVCGLVENDNAYAEAVSWCENILIYEPQNCYAIYLIGYCYMQGGCGIEVNEEYAFEQYLKAAELGHVESMYEVAWCYENAVGVEADPERAAVWYRKYEEEGGMLY